MNDQAANCPHGGLVLLSHFSWELRVVSSMGSRRTSLDWYGGQEHKRDPEHQHTGTHGAPS
jgi:hypothetical protein